MKGDIQSRARFDILRYANCWEDADVLCEALLPGPGKRILSIASAGDNAFALAAEGAEVVACDISSTQLACLELKLAALRSMSREAVLAFFGIEPSDSRLADYDRLAPALPVFARQYWDAQRPAIACGFIHSGKFERYFHLFRRLVLPCVHRKATVGRLLAMPEISQRQVFYDTVWNNRRWRWMFSLFFSRFVMGRLGRDPEFFRYVSGVVSDRILARARYALTVLPTDRNPYLQYILRGTFRPALPRYLRAEEFTRTQAGLDRITVQLGSVEAVADECAGAGFDGFNLSDIFEYLDLPTCQSIYEKLLGAARPGGRLAYWNMLAPRQCPAELVDRVRPLSELAGELFTRDLAFFYSAFVLEEVLR